MKTIILKNKLENVFTEYEICFKIFCIISFMMSV